MGAIKSSAGVAAPNAACLVNNSSTMLVAISRAISVRICCPRSLSHSLVGTTTTDALPVCLLSINNWQPAVIKLIVAIAVNVEILFSTALNHFLLYLFKSTNDFVTQIFTYFLNFINKGGLGWLFVIKTATVLLKTFPKNFIASLLNLLKIE